MLKPTNNIKKLLSLYLSDIKIECGVSEKKNKEFFSKFYSIKESQSKHNDLTFLSFGIGISFETIKNAFKKLNPQNWNWLYEFELWGDRNRGMSTSWKAEYYHAIGRRRAFVSENTEKYMEMIIREYGVPEKYQKILRDTLNAAHVDSSIELKYWSPYNRRALESHLYSLAQKGHFSDLANIDDVDGILPFAYDTPNHILLKNYSEGSEFTWWYYMNPDVQDIIKFIKYREFLIQFYYDNHGFPWEKKKVYEEMMHNELISQGLLSKEDLLKWYHLKWLTLENAKKSLDIFEHFKSIKEGYHYYLKKVTAFEKSIIDHTIGRLVQKNPLVYIKADFRDLYQTLILNVISKTKARVGKYHLKKDLEKKGLFVEDYNLVDNSSWYKNLWDTYTLLLDRIICKMFLEERVIKVTPAEIRKFFNKHNLNNSNMLTDKQLERFVDEGGINQKFKNLTKFDSGWGTYSLHPKHYTNYYTNVLSKVNYLPCPGRKIGTGEPTIIMFKWRAGQAIDFAKLKFSHALSPGQYIRTLRNELTLLKEREWITFDVSKTFETYSSRTHILRSVRWMDNFARSLDNVNSINHNILNPNIFNDFYIALSGIGPSWDEGLLWHDGLNSGMGSYILYVRGIFFRSEFVELWYPGMKAYFFLLILLYIDIIILKQLTRSSSRFLTFGLWYKRKRANVQLKIYDRFGVTVIASMMYTSYLFLIPTKFAADDYFLRIYENKMEHNCKSGEKDISPNANLRGAFVDFLGNLRTRNYRKQGGLTSSDYSVEGNFGFFFNKQILFYRSLAHTKLCWDLFIEDLYIGLTQDLYIDILNFINYLLSNLTQEQAMLHKVFYYIWTLPERILMAISNILHMIEKGLSFIFENTIPFIGWCFVEVFSIPYYIAISIRGIFRFLIFLGNTILEEAISFNLLFFAVFRNWGNVIFRRYDKHMFLNKDIMKYRGVHNKSIWFGIYGVESDQKQFWLLEWYDNKRHGDYWSFLDYEYISQLNLWIRHNSTLGQDWDTQKEEYGLQLYKIKLIVFDWVQEKYEFIYVFARYYIVDCIWWCLKRWNWSWIWAHRAELMFYAHNEMGIKVRKFFRFVKHWFKRVSVYREDLLLNEKGEKFLMRVDRAVMYKPDWIFVNTPLTYILYPIIRTYLRWRVAYARAEFYFMNFTKFIKLIRHRAFSISYMEQIFFVEILHLITLLKIFYFTYIHFGLFYPYISIKQYILYKINYFFYWVLNDCISIIAFKLFKQYSKIHPTLVVIYNDILDTISKFTSFNLDFREMTRYDQGKSENTFTKLVQLQKDRVNSRKEEFLIFKKETGVIHESNTYKRNLLKNYLTLNEVLYSLDKFPLTKEEEALDKCGLLNRGLRNIAILEKKTKNPSELKLLNDMKEVVSEGMVEYSKRLQKVPLIDSKLLSIKKDWIINLGLPNIFNTVVENNVLNKYFISFSKVWISFWDGDIWWDGLVYLGVTFPLKYKEFKYRIPFTIQDYYNKGYDLYTFSTHWFNYFIVYLRAITGLYFFDDSILLNLKEFYIWIIELPKKLRIKSNKLTLFTEISEFSRIAGTMNSAEWWHFQLKLRFMLDLSSLDRLDRFKRRNDYYKYFWKRDIDWGRSTIGKLFMSLFLELENNFYYYLDTKFSKDKQIITSIKYKSLRMKSSDRFLFNFTTWEDYFNLIKFSIFFIIKSLKEFISFGLNVLSENIVRFFLRFFDIFFKFPSIVRYIKNLYPNYKSDIIWGNSIFKGTIYFHKYFKDIELNYVLFCQYLKAGGFYLFEYFRLYFNRAFLECYNVDLYKINIMDYDIIGNIKYLMERFLLIDFYVMLFWKVIDLEEAIKFFTFILIIVTTLWKTFWKLFFFPVTFPLNIFINFGIETWWKVRHQLLISQDKLNENEFNFVLEYSYNKPKESNSFDDIFYVYLLFIKLRSNFFESFSKEVSEQYDRLYRLFKNFPFHIFNNMKEKLLQSIFWLVSHSILIPKFSFILFLEVILFRFVFFIEFFFRSVGTIYVFFFYYISIHIEYLSKVISYILFEILYFRLISEIFTGTIYSIITLNRLFYYSISRIFECIYNFTIKDFIIKFNYYFTYTYQAITGNYWWSNNFVYFIYEKTLPLIIWLEYNLSVTTSNIVGLFWRGDFKRHLPIVVGHSEKTLGLENTKIVKNFFYTKGNAPFFWTPIQNKDLATVYGYLVSYLQQVRELHCPPAIKMQLLKTRFTEVYLDSLVVLVETRKLKFEDIRAFFILASAMHQLENNLYKIRGVADKVDTDLTVAYQGVTSLINRRLGEIPHILDYYPKDFTFYDENKTRINCEDLTWERDADRLFHLLINNKIPLDTVNEIVDKEREELYSTLFYVNDFMSHPERYVDQSRVVTGSGIPKLVALKKMFDVKGGIEYLRSLTTPDGLLNSTLAEFIDYYYWYNNDYAKAPEYQPIYQLYHEDLLETRLMDFQEERWMAKYRRDLLKQSFDFESALDHYISLKRAREAYEFMAFNQKIYNFYLDAFGRNFGYVYYHFPGRSLQIREPNPDKPIWNMIQKTQFLMSYIVNSGSTMLSNVSLLHRLNDGDFAKYMEMAEDSSRFNNFHKVYLLDSSNLFKLLELRFGYVFDNININAPCRDNLIHRIKPMVSIWKDVFDLSSEEVDYFATAESGHGYYTHGVLGVYREYLDQWDIPNKCFGLRTAFEVPFKKFYTFEYDHPDWRITKVLQKVNKWNFFRESTKFQLNLETNPLVTSPLLTHFRYHINYSGWGQLWEAGILSMRYVVGEFWDDRENTDWMQSYIDGLLCTKEIFFNNGLQTYMKLRYSETLELYSQNIEKENSVYRLRLHMKGKLYKYWIHYDESDIEANPLNSEGFAPLSKQVTENNIFGIVFYDVPTEGQYGFQDPASPIMEGIIDLHHDLLFFLIAVITFVLWAMVNIFKFFAVTNFNTRNILRTKLLEEALDIYTSIFNFLFKIFKSMTKVISEVSFLKPILDIFYGFIYVCLFDLTAEIKRLTKKYIDVNQLTFNSFFNFITSGAIFEKYGRKVINNQFYGSGNGRMYLNNYSYSGYEILDIPVEEENKESFKLEYTSFQGYGAVFYLTNIWFKAREVTLNHLERNTNLLNVKEVMFSYRNESGEINGTRALVEDANEATLHYENVYFPKMFTHNTLIEIVWTVVPAIILIFIAIPSFSLLYAMDQVWQPMLSVKVLGNQWYWGYEYC